MLENLFVFSNTLPVAKIFEEPTRIVGATCDGSKFARLREVRFDAARQCLKFRSIQRAANHDGTVAYVIIDRGFGEWRVFARSEISHA